MPCPDTWPGFAALASVRLARVVRRAAGSLGGRDNGDKATPAVMAGTSDIGGGRFGHLAVHPSPVSVSGSAREAPGHRGHCRVGLAEQSRGAGGWVMVFSGDGEAMHK